MRIAADAAGRGGCVRGPVALVLEDCGEELETWEGCSLWVLDVGKKSQEDLLLCLEIPRSDGVSVLLNAVVNELTVVGGSRNDKSPEEVSDLLMEVWLAIFGVPTEIAEAIELLHIKLLNWCVVLDLVQDVVEMHLFELE